MNSKALSISIQMNGRMKRKKNKYVYKLHNISFHKLTGFCVVRMNGMASCCFSPSIVHLLPSRHIFYLIHIPPPVVSCEQGTGLMESFIKVIDEIQIQTETQIGNKIK